MATFTKPKPKSKAEKQAQKSPLAEVAKLQEVVSGERRNLRQLERAPVSSLEVSLQHDDQLIGDLWRNPHLIVGGVRREVGHAGRAR